jgi:hypothetical protein
MSIFIVIVVLLILTYIIYISLSHILLDKPFSPVGPETIPLSTQAQVLTSEELQRFWSNTSGSTLIFHINPVVNDRSARYGNEYANVVQIGSKLSFKILIAPDAGRELIMAPAKLTIITGPPTTPTTEILDIPNFPLQRWTTVALVKDGRRFNVYLNGKLTASYTCMKMPQYDPTTSLTVGDSRLGGTIRLMSISPNPLHPNEIRDLVSDSIDTSGTPYSPITVWSVLSYFIPDFSKLPSISTIWQQIVCPGGNCNHPVSAGPMQEWSVNYA